MFDYDLAEFPLFRYDAGSRARLRNEPLDYGDAIRDPKGDRVVRSWLAVPGPAGIGGPSTQVLLFDLLQLYAEQGCGPGGIRYGTMRGLLRRRGLGHPSKRDFDRLRRDLEILRGYEFRCERCFWDAASRGYVDRTWHLFPPDVRFLPSRANGSAGMLAVSPELAELAAMRGFYPLGFDRREFYRMTPLEQRLALYLARKFRFQSLHRRRLDDLLRALPIHANRARDARASLARTAGRLVDRGLPLLRSFRLIEPRGGERVAEFVRGGGAAEATGSGVGVHGDRIDGMILDDLLARIAEATGSPRDAAWWSRCIARLGRHAIERALGELREACRGGRVRSRGALLTKILKDIAAERNVELRGGARGDPR